MSQPYPKKEVQLESDDRLRVEELVEQTKGHLQDLAALISRVTETPLTPDGFVTRFEVREDVEASDEGVVIIALPTDPTIYACALYVDGQYVKVVVPC